MGDEENPDENAYTITKYLEDGQTITEHNSRNYTGKASVVYATKDKYEGDFKDGLREGVGTYTYFKEEGPQNKYEGEWLQNKKHGIGKMIYGGVGEYFGRFENGKRHGEGVFKYKKNGNVYSGSWKYGVKHGHGEFIFEKTKMKIAGEWENGKILKGKWIFPNGTYFEGPFVNNFPKGEGVWHFTNGNTVKGSFGQELKDNPNPEENAEEGEDNSQITVINWVTDPQITDPTRDLYKVEETLLLPDELNEKPNVIFVIGGPGCGKGTQCKRIVKNFGYTSFSSGDLLRKYVEEKKEGFEEIHQKMQEGALISSETVMKVLKSYILNSENKKILLDGYPRNKENMEIWEKEMKGQVNEVGALYFDVSNEEMKKRILGRNEGRADDNEETIAKRLATFERETKPILAEFENRKILIKIDGMKSVDEISEDVSKEFKERGLE